MKIKKDLLEKLKFPKTKEKDPMLELEDEELESSESPLFELEDKEERQKLKEPKPLDINLEEISTEDLLTELKNRGYEIEEEMIEETEKESIEEESPEFKPPKRKPADIMIPEDEENPEGIQIEEKEEDIEEVEMRPKKSKKPSSNLKKLEKKLFK